MSRKDENRPRFQEIEVKPFKGKPRIIKVKLDGTSTIENVKVKVQEEDGILLANQRWRIAEDGVEQHEKKQIQDASRHARNEKEREEREKKAKEDDASPFLLGLIQNLIEMVVGALTFCNIM